MNELEDIAKFLPKDSLDYQRLSVFHTTAKKRGYGKGHLWLACFASFPVFLTPDLLYKLWLNFRTVYLKYGRTESIDRMAVSDLLLSNMVEEIAVEVYAIRQPVRTALFGLFESWQAYLDTPEPPRKQLADFVLRYVRSYQMEGESVTTAIREAQEWNALAYFNPGAAALELKKALSQAVSQKAKQKLLRISFMLQQMDQQYAQLDQKEQRAQFRTLVNYSEGMQELIQGRHDKALEAFKELPTVASGGTAGTQAVRLPIPKQIYKEISAAKKEKEEKPYRLFATLVGVDKYRESSDLPDLQGAVKDAQLWRTYLNERFEGKAQIYLLQNGAATSQAVWDTLEQACKKASPGDHLLFFFAGHGQNKADGKDLNTILLYDFSPPDQKKGIISEEVFRSFTDRHIPPGVSFTLILDTHAGSDGWLDIDQPDRFIFSACTSTERSGEINQQGLFTSSILEVLSEMGGLPVSHQELIRKTRSLVRLKNTGKVQTPVLLGNSIHFHKAFLFTSNWKDLRLRELLVANGFMQSVGEKNIHPPIDQFKSGWPGVAGLDIEIALAHQQLIGPSKELQVFISQSNNLFGLSRFLEPILEKRGLPHSIYTHDLNKERELSMQKHVPFQEMTWENQLQNAHLVIILLENEWLKDPGSIQLVRLIQIRKMEGHLPVILLKTEACKWSSHLVGQLGRPWPESPIYETYQEDAFGKDLDGFMEDTLKYFQPFFTSVSVSINLALFKSSFTEQLLEILGRFYPEEVADLARDSSKGPKDREKFIVEHFPYPIAGPLGNLFVAETAQKQLDKTIAVYQTNIRLLNTLLMGLLQRMIQNGTKNREISSVLKKGLQERGWLEGQDCTVDLLKLLQNQPIPPSVLTEQEWDAHSLQTLINDPKLPVLLTDEDEGNKGKPGTEDLSYKLQHNYARLIRWFNRIDLVFNKVIIAVGESGIVEMGKAQEPDFQQSNIGLENVVNESIQQSESTQTALKPKKVYYKQS